MTKNNFCTGDIVVLHPKTKHGKDRIAQHGSRWKVVTAVGSRPNSIRLESLENTFKLGDTKTKDSRWVDLPVDKDFEIIKQEVKNV